MQKQIKDFIGKNGNGIFTDGNRDFLIRVGIFCQTLITNDGMLPPDVSDETVDKFLQEVAERGGKSFAGKVVIVNG